MDAQGGVLSSLAFGASVLRRGQNLIWFPEGQRSASGELLPFQPGIGMLLERFEVPVVPTCIRGTHAAMPPGSAIPRPRPVRVTFGDPLEPGDLAREDGDSGEDKADLIVHALRARAAAMIEEAG